MNLRDIFSKVALKLLAPVDLPHLGSHQHEINGARELKEFFSSSESLGGNLTWIYFSDTDEAIREAGKFTFYDARAKSAERTGRSEWRMYYTGSFLERAEKGDLLVLAQTTSKDYYALVFDQNSGWFNVALYLFDVESVLTEFLVLPEISLAQQALEFTRQRIIEALEVGHFAPANPSDEEIIVARFGMHFPKTIEMSKFARSLVDADPVANADSALIAWLQREEELFRALEGVIVRQKLDAGFDDVDDFVNYSLTVQNRRKSRMGHALMHDLSAIFDSNGLRYQREAKTERKHKPDFLFPGSREYCNSAYSASLLMMLGAKSTLKERWRQILEEADRISNKHLCTLDPGISADTIDEMSTKSLTLVLPSALQNTYPPAQRTMMLTLADFIREVKSRQT